MRKEISQTTEFQQHGLFLLVIRVESRISGNTAVVYSDIQLTSEVGGREVSFPFFVSETYTRTGGNWQLVTLAFTKKM